MFALHQGDCEHCWRAYRYALWHAGFGDFSYAYCDSCGMLATLDERSEKIAQLPRISSPYQEMDAKWEPFLNSCPCGGRFRNGASPRCPYCHIALSAEYAASHIERNSTGAPRGWKWQRNWSDVYCMAIEDPKSPGNMRQIVDPFIDSEV